MTTHVELRRGAYHDSVSLMQVSRAVADTPGVAAAQVAMATELNVEVLGGMGFDVPAEAGPNDLVVAIRADDAAGLDAGLAAVTDALAALRGTGDSGGGDDEVAPRTLGSAAARSGATLAVISVPGQHAVTEAFDAIASGLSVMLFSDNVSVDDEVRLKDAAAAADVLVMGPDCGTAHVAGVALGFANVVRAGSVGVVAASGTGAQQVMCLLDAAGVGVSHCLGVGGRDLKAAVGGRSTTQALRALADDPATETVLLVSKPPDATVLADVEAYAAELGLRVHWAVLGEGRPDLTAAVEQFLVAEGHPVPTWPATLATPDDPALTTGPSLRGLFCGGTLADEAMTVAEATLGGIRSNIAHSPDLALGRRPHRPGPRRHRLRRRRAHPRPRPPDDRPDPAHGADRPRGHRPDLRGAAARPRAGPRRPPRPGRRARGCRALGPRDRPRGRPRPSGRGVAHRHRRRPAGPVTVRRSAGRRGCVGLPVQRRGHPARARPPREPVMTTPDDRPLRGLLETDPVVATAGVSLLADALRDQAVPVTETQWQPPMAGTEGDLARVMGDPRRTAANALAFERMTTAEAHLVDVVPASEALGLERGTFLHAGPPLEWERASGPMRGALIGAVLFEGLADTAEDAEKRLAAGEFDLEPCHHRGAVGPMAGVISPSMWVYALRDDVHGHDSWCSLNEGLGKVLRYGAYGPEVIDRLHWMTDVLGPILRQAVRATGPIDIRAIIAQMLQMGDEGHNRNRAGSLMLLRELLPGMITADASSADVAEAVRFSGANEHFFLNLGMPACKLATRAAEGIPGSTVVTVMARNGTDFGIRVSGTGDQWFTGPANTPEGLFLGDYGPDDANPDIGDSAITETGGIGGFAMAAAPAIVRFVGGDVPFALRATRTMYEVTTGEHPVYQVPILGFRGTPTGIDVTKVVRTGILPQINTGMAGRVAGTGQVGAGLVTPPQECFPAALAALAAATPA